VCVGADSACVREMGGRVRDSEGSDGQARERCECASVLRGADVYEKVGVKERWAGE